MNLWLEWLTKWENVNSCTHSACLRHLYFVISNGREKSSLEVVDFSQLSAGLLSTFNRW